MWRFLALILAFILGLVLLVSAFWLTSNRRWTKYPDADEAWSTKMNLALIQGTLGRFNQLADENNWKAVREVRTLDSLWTLFHEIKDNGYPLVSFPIEESFLKDGWNRPYTLEIKVTDNETLIRIRSISNGGHYYVESILKGKISRTRRSWGGLDD